MEVETGEVSRKDLVQAIEASGVVATDHQAQIAFLSSGKIGAITVFEGDKVKKGQFLASLDPQELYIAQEKTLANWRAIRFQLEEFDRAHRDEAFKENIINERKILVSQLESVTKDVESADVVRRKLAVYSPIDGIVTKITKVPGENVLAGTNIILIDDLTNARFIADLDESDLENVKAGSMVLINLDAYQGRELKGKVNKIAYLAKSLNTGGTAFETTIVLDSPLVFLRSGLNGDVRIIQASKSQALTVPNRAILTENDKNYVFLLRDNKVVKTEVQTGLVTEEETEVLSGLSDGDKVVTSDQSQLKDGQKIRIK